MGSFSDFVCQGIASMIVSLLVGIFYNTILAWVLWYFFHSFQDPLPWSTCPLNENHAGNSWSKRPEAKVHKSKPGSKSLLWLLFFLHEGFNEECEKSTPVNYFWYRETLNITADIGTSGSLQWPMVICLASAWCIVYICFIRGLQSMGKVSKQNHTSNHTMVMELQQYMFNMFPGCICDSNIPLPGSDYFPDPCPHFAWCCRWTPVPLYSWCELGSLL